MSNITIKQVHDSFWTVCIGDVVLGTIHTEQKLFSKKVLYMARSTFRFDNGAGVGPSWGDTFNTFEEAEAYMIDLIGQLKNLLTSLP